MDPGSALALAAAMAVLAAMPSLSVLTVTARVAAHGFRHGAAAAAGIVAGDLVFIAIAIVGLAALAAALGNAFVWIQYLGGAYLIWQGVLLLRGAWCKTPATEKPAATGESSLGASFMAGLLLTLADQKAILFYLGFFPAFLDLNTLSLLDITLVLLITVLTVGGVKLVYAALAARAGGWAGAGTARGISLVAGLVMVAVGLALLLRG